MPVPVAGRALLAVLMAGHPLVLSAQAPADAAPAPSCVVSQDAAFGHSASKPVAVGGGPMYGASRQRRYLDALRGPAGERLTYERKGTTGEPAKGLVDRYEVRYAGLANPITLYLDFYHYSAGAAPQGFTCADSAFDLGLPPPDPFMALEQLREVALAVGREKGFASPPIELGEGPAVIIADDFYRISSHARRAARDGKPLDPGALPASLAEVQTVVIAAPRRCADTSVSPTTVALTDPRGAAAPPASSTSDAAEIARLVPGVKVPPGSLAAVFARPNVMPGLTVTVGFGDGACPSEPGPSAFSITGTGAGLIESPMPTRPAADPAVGQWVAIQAIIDYEGRFRAVRPLGGPPELAPAAAEALEQWRAQPARINRTPVPTPVVVRVAFEAVQPHN